MIKYFYILVIFICFSFTCDTVDTIDDNQIVLKSGTSFGMCGGYCKNEIQLTKQEVIYKKSGWDSINYPAKTFRGMISRTEWDSLLDAVNIAALRKLDDVYGCPDCADGGAEWIEVEYYNFHKKVTFEYGDTINQVESLILQMRALRRKFER